MKSQKIRVFFEKETFQELPGREAERKVEVKKISDPEDEESQLLTSRPSLVIRLASGAPAEAEIRYTTDGTNPNRHSQLWSRSLCFLQPG